MSSLPRTTVIEPDEPGYVNDIVRFTRAGGSIFVALRALGISFRQQKVTTYLLVNRASATARITVSPVTAPVLQLVMEHRGSRWEIRVYRDAAFAVAVGWTHGRISERHALNCASDFRRLAVLNAGLSRALNRLLTAGYAIPVVH